jgi:hypothetical protein
MKDFSAGFSTPLDLPRSRGARLIEAFSAKLERRVQFFDHATFGQWIRFEADPTVLSMCERPRRVGTNPDSCVVDFWVRRAGDEELVVLETATSVRLPPQVDGLALHTVTLAELAAAAMWISNWQRMLPVINATRGLLPKRLLKSIAQGVRQPTALGRLEHEFSISDPAVVRGALFELVRTGRLVAPRQ